MTSSSNPANEHAFRGGGATGALMRTLDWSATPLGPVSAWPQSLRTAVSIVLDSKFGMYIAWGPEYVQLYNDGYRPILGSTKHPAAMGRRASETFAESWHIIGPMFDGVRGGDAVGSEDWMLPLDRHGYMEECYFTFSYSPIRDESGDVGGVLVTVSETTARVVGSRRIRVLNAISANAAAVRTAEEAWAVCARALATDATDVPFALLYLLPEDGKRARLAGSCGVSPVNLATLQELDRSDPLLANAVDGRMGDEMKDVRARVGDVVAGDWPHLVGSALALPLQRPGEEKPYGVLVAGISPGRNLDVDYEQFLTLVAGHVSTAVTSGKALEEERRRSAALAEIDRAKTTFFSNVSHEFRTPLTLMLAPIEELRETVTGQDRDRVEMLARNASQLLKLVNTLLDFARTEAGRVEASYEPTDLAASTRELASSFRSTIERAGLTLEVACDPLPEPVYVDREMWEKIVLNLLSNAFKFTFEGSIAVRLHVDEERVTLDVSDTGTGIADQELPRVFDRFHRAEAARSRSREGSGIGLALVKDLVSMHGGEIRVRSRLGSGTTFSVQVPRGKKHLPSERIRPGRPVATSVAASPYVEEALRWTPGSSEELPAANQPVGVDSSVRIIVADDNHDMREYLARLLGERWTVEVVPDGEAALASARREPPDLVVSDVMMPRLDGFGLLKALRADERTRETAVVLLSARADASATEEGLQAGADDYIVKPFSARDLQLRISTRLAAQKSARLAREQRTNLYRHFMQAPFPVAIFRGANHVVELANDATLMAWGKGPEVVGLPILAALPELKDQPFPEHLDRVFRTGIVYEGMGELYRRRNADGTLEDRYCNYVHAPLLGAGGVVEGILLSAFDVTEQVLSTQRVEQARARAESLSTQLRAAAAELSIATSRLEAAQKVGGVGIYDWDIQNQLLYWSPELYKLLGREPGAFPPSPEMWTESLAEDDRKRGWDAFAEASAAHAAGFELELRLLQPTGDTRWVRLSASLAYDTAGAVSRILGAVVDIETLKKVAQVREQESVAADRTAKFAELFVAVLGHDLRNPLSALLLGAHLLSRTIESEPERRVVQRMLSSGERMKRMIDQILDFSRMRSGNGLRHEPAPMNLHQLVTRIAEEVSVKDKAVEVDVSGSTDGTWDADRLAQVFSNLIGNALQHSPAGKAVRVSIDGSAPHEIAVTVHNADLIPEEIRGEVFEPFRQGRQHTRSSGLGLGLYITKEIVLAHRGSIEVRSSEAEGGTTFVVRLPRETGA